MPVCTLARYVHTVHIFVFSTVDFVEGTCYNNAYCKKKRGTFLEME